MEYIIIGVLVLLMIYILFIYNSLVKLRNATKECFAQIDVYLKKRSDLIINLVDIVKGYMHHESDTLEKIVVARNKYQASKEINDKISSANDISHSLKDVYALCENYPDLKASSNFLNLQNNLSEVEGKIAYARQFYNDAVLRYKNKLEVFPSNFIGKMLGFKAFAFYEISNKEREVPKISFE